MAEAVTPFGECGLKFRIEPGLCGQIRHSLWGVWVEIDKCPGRWSYSQVTPFGECGLKWQTKSSQAAAALSLPLGSVG